MNETLAQQLVHPLPPPPVSWWPPAPGWWIVAALALLLTLCVPRLVRRLRSRSERRQYARHALAEVSPELDDQAWLAGLNTLIKRTLKKRGLDAPTRLYGDAWLDYLCQSYPRAQRAILEPLAADLYRPTLHLTIAQRRALLTELRRWMRHNHA